MALVSLTYTSIAVSEPLAVQLQHLLVRAQARNSEYQVTGALLFCAGAFAQCIEGPPASIDHIYRIILEDPLHTDLQLTSHEPIARRAFPEWSMALRTRAGSHMSWGGPVLSKRLVERPGEPSQAVRLLARFWRDGGRR
ncbi:BLUF domain-containing protein [Ramlibacter sp. AW1]|uniref:BLUF domain-containing protein n=1 Tax=Ramlibacter aurantiacus TaxID=2801330 RepID=A0A937D742_9BURK|nr:BLUF domain-containing protein [Ramlibacter aurantiacus]MBL0421613.1 BLUF domain-containing protein [Ramlibacter aurantiacus]